MLLKVLLIGVIFGRALCWRDLKQSTLIRDVEKALEDVQGWKTFRTSSTVSAILNYEGQDVPMLSAQSKVQLKRVDDVHHEFYGRMKLTGNFFLESGLELEEYDVEIVQGFDVWVHVLEAKENHKSAIADSYKRWIRLQDDGGSGRVEEGREYLDDMGFGIKGSKEVRGLIEVRELPQRIVGGALARMIAAQADCANPQQLHGRESRRRQGIEGFFSQLMGVSADYSGAQTGECATYVFALGKEGNILLIQQSSKVYEGNSTINETITRLYSQANEPVNFPIQPASQPPPPPDEPDHKHRSGLPGWLTTNVKLALGGAAVLVIVLTIYLILELRRRLMLRARRTRTDLLLPPVNDNES